VSVLLTAIVAVVGVAVYVGLFVGAILLTLGYLLRQAGEAGPGPGLDRTARRGEGRPRR
jgi:hypothetical protein